MLKKISRLLILAPLLMAFQCDDDIEPTLIYNTYTANVTQGFSFSITDTLWINGKVSSKVFDLSVNDSIFTETPQVDVFSVYKFMEPNATSNCKDAFDQFDLVFEIGEFNFLPRCENAEVHVLPMLETEGNFYSYRLGIKPKNTGDFLISWQNATLQNEERNENILDSYPIPNMPGAIGFDRCGEVSWRYVNESDREFYFSVE